MTLREVRPVGRAYLDHVSRLLQEARLADPDGGVWEAADLQWWWRVDQHVDPNAQSVWFDGDTPLVASVFSRWKDEMGCDVLGTATAVAQHAELIWGHIDAHFRDHNVSMLIREDDDIRIAAAGRAGFTPSDDVDLTGWMDVDRRAMPGPLPAGIRIEPYAGGAHPMVARNGPHVAERLAECSLYRPELDLSIREGDAVVGYALFWADPVTRVGLLEPMRVEASHQGRGLSKVLIAAGLDRLAAAGCTRLKVSFDPRNEPAARLYRGAGYRDRCAARNWIRPATT